MEKEYLIKKYPFIMKSNVHYPSHNSPQFHCVLSQSNPVHTLFISEEL
jgi:hypothetical protein